MSQVCSRPINSGHTHSVLLKGCRIHCQGCYRPLKVDPSLFYLQGYRPRRRRVLIRSQTQLSYNVGAKANGYTLTQERLSVPFEDQNDVLSQNTTQLKQLYIKDFALIHEVTVDFKPGLNIITGQSGSGKSKLIEALGMACGQMPGDRKNIRLDQQKCVVSAKFKISQEKDIRKCLNEAGVLQNENLNGEIELRRELYQNGRSRCYVNNNQLQLKYLQAIGGILVDVNGQNSQLLLKEENGQLQILDHASGLSNIKEQFAKEYQSLLEIEAKIRRLDNFATEEEREFMFNFINEVDALELKEDEDVQIQNAINQMETEKQSAQKMGYIKDMLESDQDSGMQVLISEARSKFMDAFTLLEAAWEENLGGDPESRSDAEYPLAREYFIRADDQFLQLNKILSSIASNLETGLENMEFDIDRYESLRSRQKKIDEVLRRFKKGSVNILLDVKQQFSDKLLEWEQLQEEAEELRIVQAELREHVQDLALLLSKARRKVAAQLEQAVEARLEQLHVEQARFKIQFDHYQTTSSDGLYIPELQTSSSTQKQDVQQEEREIRSYQVNDGSGIDYVQFLFGCKVDGVLRPLADVASGGEMSRLMLAIKSAPALLRIDNHEQKILNDMSQHQSQESAEKMQTLGILVFDEIDTGVGGRLGRPLASVLSSMVRGNNPSTNQVICITHIQSVAERADWHIKASKKFEEKSVLSVFHPLTSEDDRQRELEELEGKHYQFTNKLDQFSPLLNNLQNDSNSEHESQGKSRDQISDEKSNEENTQQDNKNLTSNDKVEALHQNGNQQMEQGNDVHWDESQKDLQEFQPQNEPQKNQQDESSQQIVSSSALNQIENNGNEQAPNNQYITNAVPSQQDLQQDLNQASLQEIISQEAVEKLRDVSDDPGPSEQSVQNLVGVSFSSQQQIPRDEGINIQEGIKYQGVFDEAFEGEVQSKSDDGIF